MPVRASLHPLLLSRLALPPPLLSISRGISFKAKKARGKEEGDAMDFVAEIRRPLQILFSLSPLHNSSILREGVRKNTEKLFEGRSRPWNREKL